jgi:hypothetical protein
LLGYLVNMEDWSELGFLKGSTHSEYLEDFKRADLSTVVSLTQQLLQRHFQLE